MLGLLPIALFVLLYYVHAPRGVSAVERLAEALTVFLFGYAILTALLMLVQRYDHLLVASILAAVMAAVALLGRRPPALAEPRPDANTLRFALVGVAFLAFAAERFEFVSMGADAGVYCNYAKNLERTGGSRYALDELGGRLGSSLAIGTRGLGIYCPEGNRCHYQFFPGWPAMLALGMHVFGPHEYRQIMLVIGTLLVFWWFRILGEWLQGWRLVAAAFCVALNPLLIYLAKSTFSELFLALCTMFAVQAFLRRTPAGRTIALVAGAAFVVSHISSFLLLPLQLIYGMYAARSATPGELRRFSAATGIFVGAQAIGYFFSPQYYFDVFAQFGRRTGLPLPFYALPAGAVAAALIAWAFVLRHAAGHIRSGARRPAPGERFVGMDTMARAWTAGLFILAAWYGYQLGWAAPADVLRVPYANRGFESLVHMNLVSVCLATGVVFLPVLLGVIFSRRGRPIRDWLDLALIGGLLTSLTFYQLTMSSVVLNYYLSRYFLPLIVPFITLAVLRRAAAWNARRFWLLTGPVLSFNLVFSTFLVLTPEFGDTSTLIAKLKRTVPARAVVLGLGREPHLDWLFANIVRYDLDGRYGSLGSDERTGLQRLDEFRAEANPPVLYVVSDRPLPPARAGVLVQQLREVNNHYLPWSNVVYPLTARRVEYSYFVYRLSPA